MLPLVLSLILADAPPPRLPLPPPVESRERVLEKGPVVSDVTMTEAEIRWEPVVEGATLLVTSGGTAAGEVTISDADGVQRARVRGLAPDVFHRYEVRLPDGRVAPGTFRTFPTAGSPVSFIAYGDTRTDHAAHQRVAERVATEQPDFVVNTGDLVGDGRDASDWEIYFHLAGPLISSTPFFPAIGNHDALGLLNETMLLRWFGRDRYYEVRAGSVILLFVDTTLAYGGGSAQRTWLEGRLAAAAEAVANGEASWIVALHHHPPFSSARHGSDRHVATELVPLYESRGVRLVLNGHDHVYERLESNGITYVVTGGGGAPLYDFRKILPESRVRVKTHHYLRIAADRERLDITAVDLAGNVIDRHELRAADAMPPRVADPSGDRLSLGVSLASLAGAGAIAWVISRRLLEKRNRPAVS